MNEKPANGLDGAAVGSEGLEPADCAGSADDLAPNVKGVDTATGIGAG